MSPQVAFNTVQKLRLLPLPQNDVPLPPTWYAFCPPGYALWPFGSMPPRSPPLQSYCPLEVVEPSSCTPTGRRCSLWCCIEFLSGHHYSQSFLCHLNLSAASGLTTTSELPSLWCHRLASPSTQSAPHPYYTTMPRLRHRMRWRRGSRRSHCSFVALLLV